MSIHNCITKKYVGWGVVLFIIVSLVLGAYIYRLEHREPELEVHFFSLKRGRSIFIRTPKNKTILYGGGQTSEVIRELTKVMPFYKRKLDYVVIPSATPAQIGGLVEILGRYEISQIIIPKPIATSTALTAVLTSIRKNKIHVVEVERGDVVEIEEGVRLGILFPYVDFKFNTTSLPELGASLSFGETSVYLLGNLSKTVQKDILKNTEISDTKNLVEFFNTAASAKVSSELLEKLNPSFIFSTKEKTAHAVSLGKEWKVD